MSENGNGAKPVGITVADIMNRRAVLSFEYLGRTIHLIVLPENITWEWINRVNVLRAARPTPAALPAPAEATDAEAGGGAGTDAESVARAATSEAERYFKAQRHEVSELLSMVLSDWSVADETGAKYPTDVESLSALSDDFVASAFWRVVNGYQLGETSGVRQGAETIAVTNNSVSHSKPGGSQGVTHPSQTGGRSSKRRGG